MEIRIRQSEGTVTFPTLPDDYEIKKEDMRVDGTLKKFLVFLYKGSSRFLLGEYEINLLTDGLSSTLRYEKFVPAQCFVAQEDATFYRKKGKLRIVFY